MLIDEAEDVPIENHYESLKIAIQEANAEILPKVDRVAKRPWMTENILRLMDARRKKKGNNQQEYLTLNRTIHRECRLAKERWMDERCAEVEDLEKRDQQIMYNKVNEIVGKKKYNRNIAIKKTDSQVAMEIEDVKLRWNEYIGELYKDERPEVSEIMVEDNYGPTILREEVRCAVESLRSGKAVGEDEIAVEMLNALGDFAVDLLTSLFQKIYDTGNIVVSMCDSIFIALPKVEGTLECSKHRTLSIMSQITKILLRIVLKRIRGKIRPQISDEQFGFVAGKGTNNALFTLRVLTERAIEVQKDVFACFVDYEKAFDKVKHLNLFDMLKNLDLDGKDLRLLRNLYWNQKASVKVADEESMKQEIKRGVRQGCVLSPDLFNLYSEVIM